MQAPTWLTLLVMGLVLFFGLFRIRLGLMSRDLYQSRSERTGFYRLPQRSHLVVGLVFVIMAGWLGAMGFGLLL